MTWSLQPLRYLEDPLALVTPRTMTAEGDLHARAIFLVIEFGAVERVEACTIRTWEGVSNEVNQENKRNNRFLRGVKIFHGHHRCRCRGHDRHRSHDRYRYRRGRQLPQPLVYRPQFLLHALSERSCYDIDSISHSLGAARGHLDRW